MSTMGRDEAQIRNYIGNQEKEDQRPEQLKLGECRFERLTNPKQPALPGDTYC